MRAAAEPRVVEVGQRAAPRVGGEIGAQPALLRRAGGAGHHGAVAVEHHDVPGAEVVAVVAAAGAARAAAEVREVRRRAGRPVLVVADARPGDRLQPAPAPVVRRGERGRGAALVLVVAERGDDVGHRALREAGRGGLAAARRRAVAAVEGRVGRVAGDVARSDEDRVVGADRDGGRRGRRARDGGRHGAAEHRGEGQRKQEQPAPSGTKHVHLPSRRPPPAGGRGMTCGSIGTSGRALRPGRAYGAAGVRRLVLLGCARTHGDVPIVQRPRTPPFQGGYAGSNPVGGTAQVWPARPRSAVG